MSALRLFLRATATAIPTHRVPLASIVEAEPARFDAQLAALSPALRGRLEGQLGIEAIPVHAGPPSSLALEAAGAALDRAQVARDAVTAIIDYSTMPGDFPAIWGLGNQLQGALGCPRAVPFGVRGAGCAGLHLALRVASSWLAGEGGVALLLGADCVPAGGRASLPISVMGDAASAALLSLEPPTTGPRVTLESVVTTTIGEHHALLRMEGCPPRIEVDAVAFEERVLPIHFVMCGRVLSRALASAGRPRAAVTHLVYPNTSSLDRASVGRALGFPPSALTGPGPRHLGHAFANDMLLNLPDLAALNAPTTLALVAAGSGFTWGAALLHVDPAS